LDLDPEQARWIVKGCMALFAAVVVWACRTPTAPRWGWRLAAEFGLVVLGMLLFSERTWKHHCVTLLLPFAVISYYLAACRPGAVLRGYLVGTLAAAVLLMTSTSTSLVADAKLAQVYGAYVGAYLVLAAAMVVLLKRGPRLAPLAPLGRGVGGEGLKLPLVWPLTPDPSPPRGEGGNTGLPANRRG
jgi:hypothetical protein